MWTYLKKCSNFTSFPAITFSNSKFLKSDIKIQILCKIWYEIHDIPWDMVKKLHEISWPRSDVFWLNSIPPCEWYVYDSVEFHVFSTVFFQCHVHITWTHTQKLKNSISKEVFTHVSNFHSYLLTSKVRHSFFIAING